MQKTKQNLYTNILTYLIIFVLLISLGILGRVLPHPPNFTPITAIALFSGFIFINRLMPILAIILTMLITDYFILGYISKGYLFSELMISVYICLLFPIIFRTILRNKLNIFTIASTSLASSTFFFIVTNFTLWYFSSMYEKSIYGLILCYTMAIPFFKNTIAGDIFYSGIIFAIYYFLINYKRTFAAIKKSFVLYSLN